MSLPLSEIIRDEIALEGLDGITLEGLWQRLERRCPQTFIETPKICNLCWQFVKSDDDMSCYILPAPRPALIIRNYREMPINLNEPNETVYKTNLIEKDGEMGSCEDYDTRQAIPKDQLTSMNYESVKSQYGNSLVIVASQKLRYKTLVPENLYVPELSLIDYCILERVGRARDNGMSSTGKHYLAELVPDSRSIYHRKKTLTEYGLIHSAITKFVVGASHVSVLYLLRFKPCSMSDEMLLVERLRSAIEEEPDGLLSSTKARQVFNSISSVEATWKWRTFRNSLPKIFTWRRVNQEKKRGEGQVSYLYLQYKPERSSASKSAEKALAPEPAFLNLANKYIKVSQEKQLLLTIEDAGPEGIRRADMEKALGSDRLTIRANVKMLLKNKLIYEKKQQLSKSLTIFLVASIYKDHQVKPLKVGAQKVKGRSEKENLPFETSLLDIYGETTVIRVDYARSQEPLIKMDTDVRVRRVTMAQEIISELGICLHLHSIGNIIRTRENTQLCNRTVRKLLQYLVEHGSVNFYEATFKRRQVTKMVHLISDRTKYNVKSEKFQDLLKTIHKQMVPVLSQKLDQASMKEINRKLALSERRIFNFAALKPFHMFLVHLSRFSRENRKPIREIPAEWLEKMGEGEKLPPAYEDQLSWRTFLQPRANCRNDGWITLRDIITYIPVQIFHDLYNHTETMVNVPEYLKHPIKRYYMMSQCRTIDLHSHKWSLEALITMLNRLSFIGLVRFGELEAAGKGSSEEEKLNMSIYLNKKTTVTETITMERYKVFIGDENFPKRQFEFSSPQTLHSYWDDLTRVCMNTLLSRKAISGYHATCTELKEWLKPIKREDAERLDDGSLPGDGLGAAGLHSRMVAHQYTLWDTAYKSTIVKYKTRKKPKPRPAVISGTVVQVLPKPKKARVYRKVFDDVDVQAKASVFFRTKWSPAEDTALLLARLSNLYLSATSRNVQNVSAITYRDVLHWMCLSLDKSAKMCSRRVQFLTKNDVTKATIQSCLKEMSHTKAITSKFGANFTAKLKEEYPLEEEFTSALKIHFVELVNILSGMYSKFTSNTFLKRAVSTLPDTLAEFESQFEVLSKDKEQGSAEGPKMEREDEIKVDTVYNTIHSSMCCSMDQESDSLILLDVYKNYPEEVLSVAMKRASTNQVLSKWKINHVQSKRTIPLNTKPFHLSIYYTRRFMLLYSAKILDFISQWVDEARTGNENFTGINRCFHFVYLGLNYRNAITLTICSEEGNEDARRNAVKKELEENKSKRKMTTVSFSDDVKVKDFEYQSTEILLKVNPINWHILCYLKEMHGKASSSASKKIIIKEDHCNFSCFVNELQDFDEVREFMAGVNVKEFKTNIRDILTDLKPEKEKMVAANQKDLGGKIINLRRSSKKFFDLLLDLSQDTYSPLNHMVTEIRLNEGAVFPRQSRWEEIEQKLLNWSIIVQPKKRVEELFEDSRFVQRLLKYIKEFNFEGASGSELLSYFPQAEELEKIIKILLEYQWIVVCGVEDIKFVHRNFIDNWTIKSYAVTKERRKEHSVEGAPSRLVLRRKNAGTEGQPPLKKAKVIYHGSDTPTDAWAGQADRTPMTVRLFPWIRVTGTVNKRMVDKVLGTILLYLQANSGITFTDLAERFKIYHPAHLKLLLLLLLDLDCVKVFKCKAQEVTLWSTQGSPETGPGSLLFDPAEELFVEATTDSLLSFCEHRASKKHRTGFF